MGIVSRIMELEEDLYAKIVVQEEEGHYEIKKDQPMGRPRGAYYDQDPLEEEWVVDKPKITKPNTKKRQAARAELQKILDESRRYRFIRRHIVRRALKRA